MVVTATKAKKGSKKIEEIEVEEVEVEEVLEEGEEGEGTFTEVPVVKQEMLIDVELLRILEKYSPEQIAGAQRLKVEGEVAKLRNEIERLMGQIREREDKIDELLVGVGIGVQQQKPKRGTSAPRKPRGEGATERASLPKAQKTQLLQSTLSKMPKRFTVQQFADLLLANYPSDPKPTPSSARQMAQMTIKAWVSENIIGDGEHQEGTRALLYSKK